MVKLYYTPTSCGMANFISAVHAGVKIDCEQVNLSTHRTTAGDVDFYTINPKGNVPTLVLDDGTVLNENAATLQYIADQVEYIKDIKKYLLVSYALSFRILVRLLLLLELLIVTSFK